MKVGSIIATIFAMPIIAITYAYLTEGNVNIQVAREIYCEELVFAGDIDKIDSQLEKIDCAIIRNKALTSKASALYVAGKYSEFSDFTAKNLSSIQFDQLSYNLLSADILQGKLTLSDAISRAKRLSKSEDRGAALMKILRAGENEFTEDKKALLREKILAEFSKSEPYSSNSRFLETAQESLKAGDSEIFINILNMAAPNSSRVLTIIDGIKCPKIEQAYREILKDKNLCKKFRNIQVPISYTIFCKDRMNSPKRDIEKIQNNCKYLSYYFDFNWQGFDNYMDKMPKYNYPAMAYIAKQVGCDKLYEKFRNLSISPVQIRQMRGCKTHYAEYGTRVFSRLKDKKAAEILLLSAGRKTDIDAIIRRCVRDSDGFLLDYAAR